MLLYYVCRIYILFYIQNWHRLPCAGPLADIRMKSEDSAKTVEQNKKSVDFWVNFWHLFGGRSVEKLVKSYSKYLFIGSFFSPQPFYKTNIKHYLLTFLHHTSTYQFHIKKERNSRASADSTKKIFSHHTNLNYFCFSPLVAKQFRSLLLLLLLLQCGEISE